MKEKCVICDEETGHAGIYDDSLYDVEGLGPYCPECWDKLIPELKDDE